MSSKDGDSKDSKRSKGGSGLGLGDGFVSAGSEKLQGSTPQKGGLMFLNKNKDVIPMICTFKETESTVSDHAIE